MGFVPKISLLFIQFYSHKEDCSFPVKELVLTGSNKKIFNFFNITASDCTIKGCSVSRIFRIKPSGNFLRRKPSFFGDFSAGREISEKRRLSPQEISRWFDSENSAYGAALYGAVGSGDIEKIKNLLITASQNKLFNWKTTILFMTVELNK